MNNSALEQIQQLEKQKAALVEEAKKEAIAQVQAAVDVLSALGYQYAIVQEDKHTKNRTRRGSRKPNPNKRCPVCNFQTNPPHDGRHHKNQDVKGPFTHEELAQKGLALLETEPMAERQAAE